jgi:hypothetical protein
MGFDRLNGAYEKYREKSKVFGHCMGKRAANGDNRLPGSG